MRHLLFISSLLLLFVALAPLSTRAQLKAQLKLPPSEASAVPPASNPPAAMKRTISVILPNALDVNKLKAGETVGLSAPVLPRNPLVPSVAPIVLRVMNVSRLGKDGSESRLLVRFEKLHPDPTTDHTPLHLAIQAIASPPFAEESSPMSGVIIEHYPCDPEVSRNGCDPKEDEPEPGSELGLKFLELFLCNSKQPKDNQQTQRDCIPEEQAHGMYGYPDLSLSPAPNSPDTFAIVSSKKNVKLDKGTYLVLSGPDVAAVLH